MVLTKTTRQLKQHPIPLNSLFYFLLALISLKQPRFQAADELLVSGFDPVPVSLSPSDEFITISAPDGRHLKSSIDGYVTEFGKNDDVIAVANARNMLYVEAMREKTDEDNWEEKFKTHKGQLIITYFIKLKI